MTSAQEAREAQRKAEMTAHVTALTESMNAKFGEMLKCFETKFQERFNQLAGAQPSAVAPAQAAQQTSQTAPTPQVNPPASSVAATGVVTAAADPNAPKQQTTIVQAFAANDQQQTTPLDSEPVGRPPSTKDKEDKKGRRDQSLGPYSGKKS